MAPIGNQVSQMNSYGPDRRSVFPVHEKIFRLAFRPNQSDRECARTSNGAGLPDRRGSKRPFTLIESNEVAKGAW